MTTNVTINVDQRRGCGCGGCLSLFLFFMLIAAPISAVVKLFQFSPLLGLLLAGAGVVGVVAYGLGKAKNGAAPTMEPTATPTAPGTPATPVVRPARPVRAARAVRPVRSASSIRAAEQAAALRRRIEAQARVDGVTCTWCREPIHALPPETWHRGEIEDAIRRATPRGQQ